MPDPTPVSQTVTAGTPVAAATTAASTAPAIQPPPAAPQPPADEDGWLSEIPEAHRSRVKGLKTENINLRARERVAKEEAQTSKQKLDEIEKQKLAEAGQWKDLYEKEKAEKATVVESSRAMVINAHVLALASQAGVNPKLVRLIDLTDVRIDAAGHVVGAEDAVRAWMMANPDLVAPAPATQAPAAQAAPATTHPLAGPLARTPVPPAVRAATGAATAPAPAVGVTGKKASEMTKAEYEAAKATYMRDQRREGWGRRR